MSHRKLESNSSEGWDIDNPCKIAVIGEAMLELSNPSKTNVVCNYSGDALNTATYLVRELGDSNLQLSFITALGDDPFSDEMITQWQQEGIGVEHVIRIAGKLPGLYWIKTHNQGERSFYYWRDQSAARELISTMAKSSGLNILNQFDIIYLTGISLAILNHDSRSILWRALKEAKEQGAIIAFDTNYRPALWSGRAEAKACIKHFLPIVDIAMVSDEDEFGLFQDLDCRAIILRLHSFGVQEVIVRRGAKGCCVSTGTKNIEVSVKSIASPKDTTAAGDSFNAAYIAARISGLSLAKAATNGHALAAKVIQYSGAILPRESL